MGSRRDKKPPVVLLSGIRWDFLWQRHQILATRFARAGHPTVFVETTGLANPRLDRTTLRKVAARLRRSGGGGEKPRSEPGLTVYSPLAAPPTWKAFRLLNRRVFLPGVARDLRVLTGEDSPVVVAYPPTRTTLDLISYLRPRLLYYDCSEDYEGFVGVPGDISATERELLRRADLVSYTSPHLRGKKIGREKPDAFHSGPGVDYELFAGLQRPGPQGRIRTVGYFGHLGRERIDFSALRAVARAGFTVRLVGGVGRVDKGFFEMPGVDYRGEVPHRELPAALEGVDAFLLPYLDNRLTRGISPAKTYECLATGRPVVASPLPALKALDGPVYLADRPEAFVEVLGNLEVLETETKVRERIALARQNSWDARFAEIEERLWRALKKE